MPFKSKAQQAYLYSQKPEVAKEFASKMKKSDYKKLPEKVNAYKEIKKKSSAS